MFVKETFAAHEKAELALNNKRQSLANIHRQERAELKQAHDKRHQQEMIERFSRLPTGLKALWFCVSGKYRQINRQNETEVHACKLRDQSEIQKMIDRQLRKRRHLQHEIRIMRHQHGIKIKKLNRDMSKYLRFSPANQYEALCRKKEQHSDQVHRKLRRSLG